MATFSSKQYPWADLSIAAGGRIYEGATEVEYTETREKDFLYGRGGKPHEIVHGNTAFEGKLKIWQSDLEAMTKDAPDKDILKLRFNIVITYTPKDGGQVVTDVLENCEIKEVKKGMAQGDKNMEIELPILFLDIKRQK